MWVNLTSHDFYYAVPEKNPFKVDSKSNCKLKSSEKNRTETVPTECNTFTIEMNWWKMMKKLHHYAFCKTLLLLKATICGSTWKTTELIGILIVFLCLPLQNLVFLLKYIVSYRVIATSPPLLEAWCQRCI